MEKIKDKLGNVGKRIDESLSDLTDVVKEKTKEATKSMAKAAAKKTARGAVNVATSVGKGIENRVKQYSEKIRKDIGIKKEMTPGQKAGIVVERAVDMLASGLKRISERMEESQAKRFATSQELKIEGYNILIGEGLDKAISVDRVARCKMFIEKIKDKSVLPYQLKDIRAELINDSIRGACTNFVGLLNYLKNKHGLETQAEIEFLKKQISIVKQKMMEEEEYGTGN